jgi:hypothetical protein
LESQDVANGWGIKNNKPSACFLPTRNKNAKYYQKHYRLRPRSGHLTLGFGIKDLFLAFRISREIKETSLGADVVFCITWTADRLISAPSYFLSAFMLPLTI